MALNDRSVKPTQASPLISCEYTMTLCSHHCSLQGTDVYDGVANPTSSSTTGDPNQDNFVADPTTDEMGAGAAPGFHGGRDAKRALKDAAGVVEARPGILEGANIAPLSNEEPGFGAPSTKSSTGVASTVSGGAKIAYGTVTGNEATLEQGRKEYYSEKH